jgi:GNAT superfamily N-acetyltransferase
MKPDDRLQIRPFRPEDAPERIALVRRVQPIVVVSPRGLLHALENEPTRARTRLWSAEEEGRLVGAAAARFSVSTEREDLAFAWIGVDADARRRGIGGQLYDLAEEHVRAQGARRLETWVVDDEDGHRFAVRRGFEPTRQSRMWSLDPRTVDVADLSRLERERAAEGLRLETLRAVRDAEQELHALFAEAAADEPADDPHTNLPFEEWVRTTLEHPDLSLDGSFVALDRDRPVSLAWLAVDGDARATHWFTGTLRAYRRRGLARFLKLATIRWAAANGITTLLTGNDAANADMLALNEHLGYRPLATGTTYAKDL